MLIRCQLMVITSWRSGFKLTSVMSFFAVQCLIVSTQLSVSSQLSVGANFFGVKGCHEKKIRFFFMFLRKMWSLFLFISIAHKIHLVMTFRFWVFVPPKKPIKQKTRKNLIFSEKSFPFFFLFAEKMMFY